MKRLLLFLCVCAFFPVQAAYTGGRSEPERNTPADSASRLGESQRAMNEAMAGMERAFAEDTSEPTLQDLYFLGRAVAANLLAIYKPYTGNPELTQYLNLICQAIVINNPTIGLFDGSHVLILDSTELNAFASPGGHIYLTKGLVESTSSEDMLAAIIAHELAHIKLKHGMQMINEMQFYNEMTVIVDRAFDFSGRNSPAIRRLMEFRESVTTLTDTLLRTGYSFSQEFEADQEALSLLAATGYDPGALQEVLSILRERQNTGSVGVNATHPSPVERVRNIDRWIRYYRVQDTRRYRAARFRNQ